MRFVLYVESWGEEVVENTFDNVEDAIQFGSTVLSQNEWRIVDQRSELEVYKFTGLENTARSDVERFNETAKWRSHFAERDQSREQQRVMMSGVGTRQRELVRRNRQRPSRLEQRDLNNARFRFVGDAPASQVRAETLDYVFGHQYNWFEEIDTPKEDKVNWLKEGF